MTVPAAGGNQPEVARTVEQMRENLAVLDAGPMSEDELVRMRRIDDQVHGRKRS